MVKVQCYGDVDFGRLQVDLSPMPNTRSSLLVMDLVIDSQVS